MRMPGRIQEIASRRVVCGMRCIGAAGKVWFGFCLLLLLSCTPGWSAVGGQISGTVSDATGAVIPGVEISVTNTATGVVQHGKSDGQGLYSFRDLPVGLYDLEIHKEGFRDFKKLGIRVDVNAIVDTPVTLELGATSQEISVNANSVQVDTSSTQMGEVISDEKMTTVPLNGRSYLDLLALQPGVSPTSSGEFSGGGTLSVNGGRESANAFMINGGLVEEGNQNSAGIVPNLDSIAEFRILTNNFDAEYGEFSGSQVNVITKSGTNSLHGDVFEFLRNTLLDARNFYSLDRGKYIQNQYGATLGGPILRKKLFFFVDYQGTRQDIGQSTGLIPVPSSSDRQGDVADLSSQLSGTVGGNYWAGMLSQELGYTVTAGEPYYSATCTSNANCVFPNAVIPGSAINAISKNLLPYIPQRNVGNYFTTSAYNTLNNDNEGAVHIDWAAKSNAVSGYYYQDLEAEIEPYLSATLPGFSDTVSNHSKMLNISDTTTLSQSMVNEFRVQYFRFAPSTLPTGGVGVSLASLGFPPNTTGIVPQNLAVEGVPSTTLNSYSFGVDTYFAPSWVHNTYEILDNFSIVKGRHNIKLGGMANYEQITLHLTADNNGDFSFDGAETGSDFVDFLLGAPSGFSQGVQAPMYARAKYFGLYGQDDWQINPQLTFNYGLRADVPTPWAEAKGEMETIVPGLQSQVFPGAPTGWVFPGDPGIPKTLAPTRYKNLAPRIGLAYAPRAENGLLSRLIGRPGQTSIRASFGIFYTSFENIGGQNEAGDAPYGGYWASPAPPLLATPYVDRQTGFNNGQRFPVPIPSAPSVSNPNTTLNWAQFLPISGSPGFWYKNRVPYAEDYSLSVQRQLGPNSLFMVSYVGTQGHALLSNLEANPGNAALCLSVSQVSEVAPGSSTCGPAAENGVYTTAGGTVINGTRSPLGPNFGSDNYEITIGNSNYHSLQGAWKYRTGPLELLVGYTWSKSIDDSSGYGDQINPFNHRLSRALSAFNVPQNLVASYHYELPFDKLLKSSRLSNGWILSGILRFASGLPVTMTETDDRSLTGTGGGGGGGNDDEPRYMRGPLERGSNPRACVNNPSCKPYFNTSLFSEETEGFIGNSMPRFFSGPGINNFDTALLKDTRLTEGKTLEFRFEFFNVFNHAQFLNPSGNINNGAFGYVSSAGDPRIGQVAMKFLF
jgi:hypothetical protein